MVLALRDFIASYFFFSRSEANQQSPWPISVVAYVSAALPLCYSGIPIVIQPQTQMLASLLIIFGFTLVALATIDLSSRMGISPAVRGEICRSGVYRFVSHPMYLGYVVAEIGIVIGNPANFPLFAVSLTLYVLRMRVESHILRNQSMRT
jgi:protein-S-isoprenylcysteine O-methyltransferase Ste14